MLYKKNKALFKNQDRARDTIRYLRGSSGKYNRDKITDKSLIQDRTDKESAFPPLPEPMEEMPDWGIVHFDGPLKVGVLQDAHIPYHDKQAIELAVNRLKTLGVDTILLNGDICDFFSVSFWQNDPRQRDLKAEVDSVNAFLDYLCGVFPKAKIIFKHGNHEERFERYIMVKAPELLDMDCLGISTLFNFDGRRIFEVKDMRPIKLGKLTAIHGHEYRFSIQNPVNPARGLFLRSKSNVYCGHFHQSSHHPEKTIEGKVLSCWSGGCLCNLHPRYRPLNNWIHGFSFIQVDKDGAFQVENPRIIDCAIWE